MSKCLMCSWESHNHKYCSNCITLKSNAWSIIRQNTQRLEKLFKTKRYTLEWFEKFELYISNINRQKDVLLEFLKKDTNRRLNKRA